MGVDMAHCIKLTQLHLHSWQKEGCCAKVIMWKVSGVMRRLVVALALQAYCVPFWIYNFIIRVLHKVALRAEVGNETLVPVVPGRGIEQGTLESPVRCQIVTGYIAGYVLYAWLRDGACLRFDQHRLDDTAVGPHYQHDTRGRYMCVRGVVSGTQQHAQAIV